MDQIIQMLMHDRIVLCRQEFPDIDVISLAGAGDAARCTNDGTWNNLVATPIPGVPRENRRFLQTHRPNCCLQISKGSISIEPVTRKEKIQPAAMNKPIARVWTFASDSNPAVEYQTLQYGDGTTSCSCPGWCRRVAADGSRSCKHSRWVDLGTADQHCRATHHYKPKTKELSHAKHQTFQLTKLGHRKFAL